ncbi:hypothetical protein FYJ27_11230 [Anaerosalibacter bizertensis]|uniref:Uncharacterized protein n=1 Tax=Anaerosalibacter bizertensis TaxID=932217 RepID=A0A844FK03_9FIRM|nr:hypothetical protein [Anaerosalibacter bizertensis]MSS44271.1 hypothetical protein [Anaerosalibacter bizertensis]
MDKISISLTKKELDILNRALTGYEKELNEVLEVEPISSLLTKEDAERRLQEAFDLNERLRNEKWEKFCWKRRRESE